MGSADVQRFADRDDEIHVAWSARDRLWWAVSKEGSWGNAGCRDDAIKIAKDASATGFHGNRRIVVHTRSGAVQGVISKTRQQPSTQLFQDDVE